jgi:hypothetical protein
MADPLDFLRNAALDRRVKGMSGGLRIFFSPKHEAQLRRDIWELPEKVLLAAAEAKPLDPQLAAASSAPVIQRAMNSTALTWLFKISSEAPDLCLDVIKLAGWDCKTSYSNNRPVFFCHDSGVLPVGQSSAPYPSGNALMANVTFPEPGTSAMSDQVRAMVAAGILRGASVGFIPGQFKLSRDPARPLGIDFTSGHILTEWSLCGIPCQPSCLVVGPTSSGKSAGDEKIADRRREARVLAAQARALCASIDNNPPQTREERIAEAQAFRRAAEAGK